MNCRNSTVFNIIVPRINTRNEFQSQLKEDILFPATGSSKNVMFQILYKN